MTQSLFPLPEISTFLARSRPASTSATTIYTTPTSRKTALRNLILANTTAAAATISVSVVPSGGTAGDDNRILKNVSIPANSTTFIDLDVTMNAGDFISIQQGTASAIVTTASGVTF